MGLAKSLGIQINKPPRRRRRPSPAPGPPPSPRPDTAGSAGPAEPGSVALVSAPVGPNPPAPIGAEPAVTVVKNRPPPSREDPATVGNAPAPEPERPPPPPTGAWIPGGGLVTDPGAAGPLARRLPALAATATAAVAVVAVVARRRRR